ncbi:MAG TPA: CcoQ/FixQ family Cbb3-type cytochrome c oxidase assembly chaperone [Chitinophagaceae bacterium]|nr:CcoQ/FixQ family Cbb3-type cytochrome c oxidase assembly chaperone [Chitinophagaceae bacterium]MCB9054451.1 CcoQ/FixQ family Cbb3-type cytochrome c oxidase assembly chaperone [Chitinophagales bacterium]HPG11965.1 CcoQ/FixQ family Cbb3-type cytochrome c oxidase assembly chaperone [Chitinophagaceae bacterium]
MKFIHYIEKVSGVDIMGLLSLVMFVSFFIIMLVWVFRTNKNKLKEISKIPLDN